MTITRSTIIFAVIGLLVLGAAAYITFGANGGSAVVPVGAPASEAEQKFLSLTSRIDPVEFDTSILEDPRFKALRDIRIDINAEIKGRTDPFAPLR